MQLKPTGGGVLGFTTTCKQAASKACVLRIIEVCLCFWVLVSETSPWRPRHRRTPTCNYLHCGRCFSHTSPEQGYIPERIETQSVSLTHSLVLRSAAKSNCPCDCSIPPGIRSLQYFPSVAIAAAVSRSGSWSQWHATMWGRVVDCGPVSHSV